MRIRKKDKVILLLFILLVSLGIAYAYLTTNLNIPANLAYPFNVSTLNFIAFPPKYQY